MIDTNKEKLNSVIISKFLHREFDSNFDDLLVSYIKEGSILGNLARLSKKINSNLKPQITNNYEFSEWQFGEDNE